MNSIVPLTSLITRKSPSKSPDQIYSGEHLTFGSRLKPHHIPLAAGLLVPIVYYLAGSPQYVDTTRRGPIIVDGAEMGNMAKDVWFNKSLDLQIEAMNACAEAEKQGIDVIQIIKDMGLEIPEDMAGERCSIPRGIFDTVTLENLIERIEAAMDQQNPFKKETPYSEIA